MGLKAPLSSGLPLFPDFSGLPPWYLFLPLSLFLS
jgi:hypothetical protein